LKCQPLQSKRLVPGRVSVRGPSYSHRYCHDPEEPAASDHNDWLGPSRQFIVPTRYGRPRAAFAAFGSEADCGRSMRVTSTRLPASRLRCRSRLRGYQRIANYISKTDKVLSMGALHAEDGTTQLPQPMNSRGTMASRHVPLQGCLGRRCMVDDIETHRDHGDRARSESWPWASPCPQAESASEHPSLWMNWHFKVVAAAQWGSRHR